MSICSTLRKFKKGCKNPIYCKIIGSLVERAEENSGIVRRERKI